MSKYINTIKLCAKALEEDTDRITLEPLAITKPTCKRHACIALEAMGRIQYWDTKTLYQWCCEKPQHPISRRPLNQFEKRYIVHYYIALLFEENNVLDEDVIYKKFIENNGNLHGNDLLAARALLSPLNFANHFRDYPPVPETICYEREQAELHLSNAKVGTWLLRRSSLGHPDDQDHAKLITNLGLEFYVVSIKRASILHHLILHRPGWGWSMAHNVRYNDVTIIPRLCRGQEKYFVCFIDVLLEIVKIHKLKFENASKSYITIQK